jgi:hypothetical protein
MIHAAALLAPFLDTVSQAPIIVQCSQPVPEPLLKWLLPTLVQTIVSLVSIGSGVGIAVWSFRKNRQSDSEQWVRDQKKAEWRELIEAANTCEDVVSACERIIRGKDQSLIIKRVDKLAVKRRIVLQRMRDRLFINESVIPLREAWLTMGNRIRKARSNFRKNPDSDVTAIKEELNMIKGIVKQVRETARQEMTRFGSSNT